MPRGDSEQTICISGSRESTDDRAAETAATGEPGEWQARLEPILERIPAEWGRWIACDSGWHPLICRLDDAIAALVPDYEIHQVKEKFGGLRFYYELGDCDEAVAREVEKLVGEAEREADRTCEQCSAEGERRKTRAASPWYKTLCSACAGERYLDAAAWDAWWREEKPHFITRLRENFRREHEGLRVIVASRDGHRLACEAIYARDAAEIACLLARPCDELWLGNDELGELALGLVLARGAIDKQPIAKRIRKLSVEGPDTRAYERLAGVYVAAPSGVDGATYHLEPAGDS